MRIPEKYRDVIRQFLDQLENDIDTTREFLHIQDPHYQNQFLDSIYLQYSTNVFNAIEELKQDSINTRNISLMKFSQKEFACIVEFLELEKCPIISEDPFLTNKDRMLDYVARMKVKLKNNYYLDKR